MVVCADARAQGVAASGSNGVPCAALAMAVVSSTGDIYLNSASTVDSYQSNQGHYGGSNVGSGAVVQAGASIVNNGGVVHGSAIQSSPSSLAIVPVPAGAINLPLGSSSPGWLNINGASDSISLAPGNYVAAGVNVNYPGSITISPPGPVAIWVTGSLNLGGDENLNGVPANLAFLVTSSGWDNVNSNGQLFGSIYAPTSGINLDSAVFGSVVGSTVTLNSGSGVHYDQSSACSPPPVNSPHALPAPPQAEGCYAWITNGWDPVPCMTPAEETNLPPPTWNASENAVNISTTPCSGPDGGLQTPSFVFGQVETTFVSISSELDYAPDDAGVMQPWSPNAVSVQTNTNGFGPPSAGPNGCYSLQFTIQQNPDNVPPFVPGNRICIWQIQYAELDGGPLAEGVDYGTPSCVNPPGDRDGGYRAFDFATVAGSTFVDDAGAPWVGLVAELSWGPDGASRRYATVAPDAYGLSGSWTGVKGSVYGLNHEGEFGSGTEVLTRVTASTCPGDIEATSPICPSMPALASCARMAYLNVSAGIGESSNLVGETPPTPLASLNANLVTTDYLASVDGGACVATGGYAYVKDYIADTGGEPSWQPGEETFWESPDIFVVPVDAGVPGPNDVPEDFVLTGGASYDVWLRVRNDFGCGPVSGTKVLIFGANPDLGFQFWSGVTAGSDAGAYVGNSNVPNEPSDAGATIPALGQTFMGPFPWTLDVDGGGHKCLLAAVEATGEPPPIPPDASLPPAYQSNQVAQRNLQIADVANGSQCVYPISNTSGADVALMIGVSVTPANPAPGSREGPVIILAFDDPMGIWYETWSQQVGLPVATNDVTTTITLNTSNIALDTVTLPPLPTGQLAPKVTIGVVSGLVFPPQTVALSSTLTTLSGPLTDAGTTILLQNGGACQLVAVTNNGCGTGLRQCGAVCVNELNDPNNCGECDNPCASDYYCNNGDCEPESQIH
jgi:hypothetical protein